MLKKELCKWEDIDERHWKYGYVCCPYENHQAKEQRDISAYGLYGYVCPPIDFGMEIKYKPPEDCPYVLEQLLHAK
jgi:hypothetical protein